MLTVNGAKSKITRPVNRIHRNGDIKKTSWQAGLAKQAWFVMSHATGKNGIVGKDAG
jgi:hypothetical protein